MTGNIIFGCILFLILTLMGTYININNKEEAEARRNAKKEAEAKRMANKEKEKRRPPVQDVESDILYALRELNCCPEYYKRYEDGNIRYDFEYQGENLALIVGKGVSVKIFDPYWYSVHKEDVDRYAECRRIINELNIKHVGLTVFFLEDEAEQVINICTINSVYVSKNHDELVERLKRVLKGYFNIHQEFQYRMMQAGFE